MGKYDCRTASGRRAPANSQQQWAKQGRNKSDNTQPLQTVGQACLDCVFLGFAQAGVVLEITCDIASYFRIVSNEIRYRLLQRISRTGERSNGRGN